MTIGQLRKLIKYLPSNTKIGVVINDEIIKDMCQESGIVEMEDYETGEKELALLIVPCECETITDLKAEEIKLNLN